MAGPTKYSSTAPHTGFLQCCATGWTSLSPLAINLETVLERARIVISILVIPNRTAALGNRAEQHILYGRKQPLAIPGIQAASLAAGMQTRLEQRLIGINIANAGYFSADDTVEKYAKEIWNIKPNATEMKGKAKDVYPL